MPSNKAYVIVCADFQERGMRILVGRNVNPHQRVTCGFGAFPGGTLENDELSDKDGAIREFGEETGNTLYCSRLQPLLRIENYYYYVQYFTYEVNGGELIDLRTDANTYADTNQGELDKFRIVSNTRILQILFGHNELDWHQDAINSFFEQNITFSHSSTPPSNEIWDTAENW